MSMTNDFIKYVKSLEVRLFNLEKKTGGGSSGGGGTGDWYELPTGGQPTYATSLTLTNPTGIDWTEYIEPGDMLKWNDGADKTAYASVITSTTLTIVGATVNNASITDFRYLKNRGVIAGTLVPVATSVAPPGYLLCNGTAVSRTTYALLFGMIGTAYGVGDGSTTFNLPDLRGRTIAGYNSADADFDAIGKTGGAKTHVLTVAQLPSHTHATGNNAGHSAFGGTATGVGPASGNGFATALNIITSGATGSGNAHNNLQPYIALNYAIKF